MHGVRRAEIQTWPIKSRGNVAHLLESRRGRRIVQIKLRVGDDELLLRDVVQTLLLKHEVIAKTVVKDAKAQAEDGLGRLFSASINAPSKAETRRKIGVVTNVVLTFVAQSGTQGDIWLDTPIVLNVQPSIKISHIGKGATSSDRVLTRAAARSDDLRH